MSIQYASLPLLSFFLSPSYALHKFITLWIHFFTDAIHNIVLNTNIQHHLEYDEHFLASQLRKELRRSKKEGSWRNFLVQFKLKFFFNHLRKSRNYFNNFSLHPFKEIYLQLVLKLSQRLFKIFRTHDILDFFFQILHTDFFSYREFKNHQVCHGFQFYRNHCYCKNYSSINTFINLLIISIY